LKNIKFEELDQEVKNRMFGKIENLKNTWEEFLTFEKYHKKVFSNNPYIINQEITKSKIIEQNKRKSIFESPAITIQNRTSESFKDPFNNNPFSSHKQSHQAESPHPNNQFANADINHSNNMTKSDQNTTMNSNDKPNEHQPVILPYLNDDLIRKYRTDATLTTSIDIFDLKLEDTVSDMKPKW